MLTITCCIVGNALHLTSLRNKTKQEILQLIKVNAEVTLGLIPVLSMGIITKTTSNNKITIANYWFTQYINIAVIGNILMMIFVNTGNSMIRGKTSQLVCIGLVIWLCYEIHQFKDWQTVEYDHGYFIYVAAPLPWIIAHALYRSILITLPSFDTSRYLTLEFTSLSSMFLLYYLHQQQFPSFSHVHHRQLAHFFGMADTITIATLSMIFGFFDIIPEIHGTSLLNRIIQESKIFDTICVGIHCIVLLCIFIGYGLSLL
jgi:hypothetical protein